MGVDELLRKTALKDGAVPELLSGSAAPPSGGSSPHIQRCGLRHQPFAQAPGAPPYVLFLDESNNGRYATANIRVIPRFSTDVFSPRYDRLMRQGASSCREEPVMGSLTYLSVMDKNKPSAITPVRALIYARASQDRLKLMRSIGDQVSDCRSWCQPLG